MIIPFSNNCKSHPMKKLFLSVIALLMLAGSAIGEKLHFTFNFNILPLIKQRMDIPKLNFLIV